MVKTSIARTVQTLLENDPSFQDALKRGYGNFSAISRLLKPKVEKNLERKVTLEGVITAVKRAKTKYDTTTKWSREVIAKSSINLRTDVAKIAVEKTRSNLEKSRLALVDFPEFYFHILEGTTTLTLITDQKIFHEVSSIFSENETVYRKQNLAAIIVNSPNEIVNTPGCIAAFYNTLARGQVNIEETISSFTETIIILRMENVARAF